LSSTHSINPQTSQLIDKATGINYPTPHLNYYPQRQNLQPKGGKYGKYLKKPLNMQKRKKLRGRLP